MGDRNALRYGYTAETAPEGTRWMYNALAPKEGTQYGDVVPLARDAGGGIRPAMPNALREGLLGLADLLSGVDTGEVTGRGANSITMGGLGTGMAMAPRGAVAMGGAPIKAYHGSPHNFDRFSFDKIGTGEGAQAYGHGLYFAENEGVARGYRDTLARKFAPISWDGKTLTTPTEWTNATRAIEDAGDWRSAKLMNHYAKVGGSSDYRFSQLADWYRDQPEMMAALERMKQRINVAPEQGSMYEVAIHADPQRFLDYDKVLAQQAPEVRDAVNRVARSPEPYGLDRVTDDMRGVQIKKMLDSPEGVQAMRDLGVPGIRYLDQGSRTAGEGSHNYVVFPTDAEIIQILRKYGLMAPAPVAVPSGNALAAPAGNPMPNGMRRPEDREY